jgi:uncharacterized SAM-binding protein YcdF (DUF218 family)
LPRAIPLFEREGFQVLPAPTAFTTPSHSLVEELMPESMNGSREALREHLGQLFNRIKDALP